MSTLSNKSKQVNQGGSAKKGLNKNSSGSVSSPIPENRAIPKTYTLRTLKMLLLKYEFRNQNPRCWGFLEWLEAREKQQEEDATKLFGIE